MNKTKVKPLWSAAKFREARLRCTTKYSMADVAEKVGKTYEYIRKLEVGERANPSPVLLVKLAELYGVDFMYFRNNE